MAPVPMRGQRNESAFLVYIMAKIAETKCVSEDEVATVTTANVKRIFGFN